MKRDFLDPRSPAAISHRLKLLRTALDLTQAQIGQMAGVTGNAWQNYEAGIRIIGLTQIWALNAATGTTIEWILEGRATDLPQRLQKLISEALKAEAGPPSPRPQRA